MNLLKKYEVSTEDHGTFEEISEESIAVALEELDERLGEIEDASNDVERLNTAAKEIELQDEIKESLTAEHEGELPESVQVGLQLARRATVASLGVDPNSEEGEAAITEVTDPVSTEGDDGKQTFSKKLVEGIKKTFRAIFEKIIAGFQWLMDKFGRNSEKEVKETAANIKQIQLITKEIGEPEVMKLLEKKEALPGFTKEEDKTVYILPKTVFEEIDGKIQKIPVQRLNNYLGDFIEMIDRFEGKYIDQFDKKFGQNTTVQEVYNEVTSFLNRQDIKILVPGEKPVKWSDFKGSFGFRTKDLEVSKTDFISIVKDNLGVFLINPKDALNLDFIKRRLKNAKETVQDIEKNLDNHGRPLKFVYQQYANLSRDAFAYTALIIKAMHGEYLFVKKYRQIVEQLKASRAA
jgi:hypothetical protein|nr:MAG TPA: hypothetical protein [Caudoviricetes sp.]